MFSTKNHRRHHERLDHELMAEPYEVRKRCLVLEKAKRILDHERKLNDLKNELTQKQQCVGPGNDSGTVHRRPDQILGE